MADDEPQVTMSEQPPAKPKAKSKQVELYDRLVKLETETYQLNVRAGKDALKILRLEKELSRLGTFVESFHPNPKRNCGRCGRRNIGVGATQCAWCNATLGVSE